MAMWYVSSFSCCVATVVAAIRYTSSDGLMVRAMGAPSTIQFRPNTERYGRSMAAAMLANVQSREGVRSRMPTYFSLLLQTVKVRQRQMPIFGTKGHGHLKVKIKATHYQGQIKRINFLFIVVFFVSCVDGMHLTEFLLLGFSFHPSSF